MSETSQQAPDQGSTETKATFRARLRNLWEVEFSNLRLRVFVFSLCMRLLPNGKAANLRTSIIRAIGAQVGRGTRFLDTPKIQSNAPGPIGPRLRIGSYCTVGSNVILEFGEVLTIGDHVSLADGVVILTTTHQLGPKEHRAGPVVRNPVVIGNDVEIGANSIILPGAKIGDGARVLPNSVVNASVAPGVTVSGIPARPLRTG